MMKIAHKCLGAIWLLFSLYAIVFLSKPIISRGSRIVDIRQEWKEKSVYSTWVQGDYYFDRELDGEIYREFYVKEYYDAYGRLHSSFGINLLISKDDPPSKFKLHYGNWDKTENSTAKRKYDDIQPYALFYTADSISTFAELTDEFDKWFRRRALFDKNALLFAIKLTHPDRHIQEVRICFPKITDPNPVYYKGENSLKVLSEASTIALDISEPMSIDVIKPLPAIINPPPKAQYLTKGLLSYAVAMFTTPMSIPFSWGLVAILSCHFTLGRINSPRKRKPVKIVLWIILAVSYVGVIRSMILYFMLTRAMSVI